VDAANRDAGHDPRASRGGARGRQGEFAGAAMRRHETRRDCQHERDIVAFRQPLEAPNAPPPRPACTAKAGRPSPGRSSASLIVALNSAACAMAFWPPTGRPPHGAFGLGIVERAPSPSVSRLARRNASSSLTREVSVGARPCKAMRVGAQGGQLLGHAQRPVPPPCRSIAPRQATKAAAAITSSAQSGRIHHRRLPALSGGLG